MNHVLGSIPSPGSGSIGIGPLQLRAYGLMIALGVLAAVWLTSKRWVARGGNADDVSGLALWVVPAGVIGARLYHVITDWRRFTDEPWRAFFIWEGGLGIWGGIAVGAIVGVVVARRRHLPALVLLDCAAPALALAQAIGRWGNWFNQELFGRPTDLPWALEIDPSNRPEGYEQAATFHPTFLYESLWNLALTGVLLWVDRRCRLPAGRLFALYVAGYTFARFFIERIRIDEASQIFGLRVNEWVSAVVFFAALAVLLSSRIRGPGTPRPMATSEGT